MNTHTFQETVWEKGQELFRPMPWRDQPTPYFVLVSELMLQQTQVDRVIPKFLAFTAAFPTFEALAEAPLSDVLIAWSGLGYNRRAKFLHQAAQAVVREFGGRLPADTKTLKSLPGVGPNTAGAIAAYAFNQPAVFIETNVRTVYFHHFFNDQPSITDKELAVIVEETMDIEHPREWYWALMDYGAQLKKQGNGVIDKSAHYKKQSPLKGSVREVRGLILKTLAKGGQTERDLRAELPQDGRFEPALQALEKEGLVIRQDDRLHLPSLRYNK